MNIKKFTTSCLILLIGGLIVSACGNPQSDSGIPVQSTATSDLPASDNVQLEDQDFLVASLELPDTLLVNEPVTLKFTLQNLSDEALYFLKWYTPLEGISGEIFRVKRDGQLVPYEGILAMRADPLPESYIHLDPGESVSAEVDLSQAYDFSKSGVYTVAFLSPNISHIASSEAEMAKSVDNLYPVSVSSNEVSVEIVENSSNESSFGISAEGALAMIKEYLRGQQSDLTEELDLEIEELTPDYVWENLHVQIFRVIEGEAFINETFLISEERLLQMGTAAGGRGVTSMLISDMDKDGESELLFTFSFDSGTYQSRIGMYAPSYNEYPILEPTITYLGDLGLSIRENGDVDVRIVEADEAYLRLKYLDTLGNLALREQNDGVVLSLKLNADLSDEIKDKLITDQATSDCQFLGRIQIDIVEAGDSSREAIAAKLWTRYLEQFQSSLLPDRCKLTSFIVDEVIIDPKEGNLISVGPDEYLALVEYAVQVEQKEGTIWMAGSGREIEGSGDGWIGKTALVKVSKQDNVYILLIQGFG
jgi:hypothetical protein